LPESPRVSNRTSRSRVLSRAATFADSSLLETKTLAVSRARWASSRSFTHADSRWDSSLSLLDSPPSPNAHAAEADAIENSSREVAPRSQQTMVAGQLLSVLVLTSSEKVKPLSTVSSQGIPTEIITDYLPQVVNVALRLQRKCLNKKSVHCLPETPRVSNRTSRSRVLSRAATFDDSSPLPSTLLERKTLEVSRTRWASSRALLNSSPPKAGRRASLAEARWDSSRSLSDYPPSAPKLQRPRVTPSLLDDWVASSAAA
jgi:hypothetical protein